MTNRKTISTQVVDFAKRLIDDSTDVAAHAEAEVKSFVNYLVEKGRVSTREAQRLYDEIVATVHKGRTDFDKKFDEGTRKALWVLNVPTRDEVTRLDARVKTLSRKVAALKKELQA
ncbi:phasin family protein [bacterium]|nr:phasin family protein [bacterium]